MIVNGNLNYGRVNNRRNKQNSPAFGVRFVATATSVGELAHTIQRLSKSNPDKLVLPQTKKLYSTGADPEIYASRVAARTVLSNLNKEFKSWIDHIVPDSKSVSLHVAPDANSQVKGAINVKPEELLPSPKNDPVDNLLARFQKMQTDDALKIKIGRVIDIRRESLGTKASLGTIEPVISVERKFGASQKRPNFPSAQVRSARTLINWGYSLDPFFQTKEQLKNPGIHVFDASAPYIRTIVPEKQAITLSPLPPSATCARPLPPSSRTAARHNKTTHTAIPTKHAPLQVPQIPQVPTLPVKSLFGSMFEGLADLSKIKIFGRTPFADRTAKPTKPLSERIFAVVERVLGIPSLEAPVASAVKAANPAKHFAKGGMLPYLGHIPARETPVPISSSLIQ